MILQAPGIILPSANQTGAPPGFLDTETIADLVEHTSLEVPVNTLDYKMVEIMALEVVAAGIPGALWCWIEISPILTTANLYWPAPLPASANYWGAIGGGGGMFPPTAPVIEVGTGVNGAIHPIKLPWNIHSNWARLVIQTPIAASLPTAFWVIQAVITGRK